MSYRGITALTLAALAAVAVSGCGQADEGADDGEVSATPIDPALLECGAPANDELQLSHEDLTAVTWAMPEGFVETFAYSEDYPIEHVESFWAAEPEQDPVPLNVLAITVYGQLDWGEDVDDCGQVPLTAVDDRLAGYLEVNGAQAITEPEAVEVAGLPAYRQDLHMPEYDYRGYWVFGRSHLVHLYCQWTTDAERREVLSGCDDLVDSLEVAGA